MNDAPDNVRLLPARRLLPHSPEAEQSIVGGILLHPRALAQVADRVEPADFYHPTLAAIYQAMLDLDGAGKPIDQLTVAARMREAETAHRLRALGGEAYFAELMAAVVTIENLGHYAGIVRSKAVRRRLIEAGQEIAARGYADSDSDDEHRQAAEKVIFELSQRGAPTTYQRAAKVLRGQLQAIERRCELRSGVIGIPSGYPRLDATLAGLQAGLLYVIAARPSMGKTALAMNIAAHVAIEQRAPVLVFSLEMSKESLVERMLCTEARIDSTRMRAGLLEGGDWKRVASAASRIGNAPLYFDDAGAPTLVDLRAKARRWRSNPDEGGVRGSDGPALVAVDYLQLVHGEGENREQVISAISRGLKALAKELRCPVVALSQLNRGVESRGDKRPQLSDLRESGAIEQDADVIAFIYRDEVYNRESRDRGIAEIIIGKQREGPTGVVRLAFLQQFTRFENLAAERDPDAYETRSWPGEGG